MAARNPKFNINLVSVFNKTFAGAPRELRDQLRGVLARADFRRAFGEAVIDRIVERTLSGVDKRGDKFEKYSEAYKRSDIFKIYGKSAQVNLELTGEMLSSMRAVRDSQSLTIEMIGEENKAKASGHVYGIRRRNKPRVKRDFLGLPMDDLTAIMNDTVETFQSETFQSADALFRGSDPISMSGQVGNQPAFTAEERFQRALIELERVMRGE